MRWAVLVVALSGCWSTDPKLSASSTTAKVGECVALRLDPGDSCTPGHYLGGSKGGGAVGVSYCMKRSWDPGGDEVAPPFATLTRGATYGDWQACCTGAGQGDVALPLSEGGLPPETVKLTLTCR